MAFADYTQHGGQNWPEALVTDLRRVRVVCEGRDAYIETK
jgi:hypothetical protein